MIYDCLIIGAGPGGLSAGIYAGRNKLKTAIIEQGQDGGQIALTADIENYPGQVLDGESGISLADRMASQAERFGVERIKDSIGSVELTGDIKKLHGKKGTYEAKTVILSTGAFPKPIGCKGEAEFLGRGLSFCATCDGAFFSGLQVFVVGGGDSACEEAIYLTKFAKKVTIIHRRDELRAAKSIQDKVFKNEKIDFAWNSVVDELKGDDVLNEIVLKDTKTGELRSIKADPADGFFGVFGFIGFSPRSDLFKDQITLDNGYVVTDEDMHTNIPGVYAVGDVRRKSLRQVVTAAADGAIAAMEANKYIEG